MNIVELRGETHRIMQERDTAQRERQEALEGLKEARKMIWKLTPGNPDIGWLSALITKLEAK